MTEKEIELLGSQLVHQVHNDPHYHKPAHDYAVTELKRLGLEVKLGEDDENTAEYNLYYSLASEFHVKIFTTALKHSTRYIGR